MIFSSLPPDLEERTLLVELNQRINNEFASVINLVSVAAPAGIGENSATTRAGRQRSVRASPSGPPPVARARGCGWPCHRCSSGQRRQTDEERMIAEHTLSVLWSKRSNVGLERTS